jgi:hypothetical protein
MNPFNVTQGFADYLHRFVSNPKFIRKMNEQLKGAPAITHPFSAKISPKRMKKIMDAIDVDRNTAFRIAVDEIIEDINQGVVVKKGKIFFREPDNSLVRDKQNAVKFSEWIKDPENAKNIDVIQANSQLHGKPLFDKDLNPIDIEIIPSLDQHSVRYMAFEAVHAAEAAKRVGVKRVPTVVINRSQPLSYFPKPASSYRHDTNTVLLSEQAPGDAYHEMTHVKDADNPLLRYLIPANDTLGKSIGLTFPVAYVAGDEISDAIPGQFDNRVIGAVKKWGPEMFLASQLGNTLGSEYRTYRNTKRLLENEMSPGYKPMAVNSAKAFAPESSIDQLIKHHQYALGTYFARPAIYYGAMRGSAFAYDKLNKEGSITEDAVIGPIQAMKASFKRGVESAKHFPAILESMMLSSPYAPAKSVAQWAFVAGIPIALAYGINRMSDPYAQLKSTAVDEIKGTML